MKPNIFCIIIIAFMISANTDPVYAQDSAISKNENYVKAKDTVKYALLYVYRQRKFENSLGSYDIHVGDSIVGRIKNNSKFVVKLYNEGPATIWAKTEKKVSVAIDLKFGGEYF